MNIFIADYLPIKNKGEEALLRGIESLYHEKYKTEINFFVFGSEDSITRTDNITSFPVKWCYPSYKYPHRFVGRNGLIRKIICTILFRLGTFPYIRNISKHPEVIAALKQADVILLAHDGFYHTFCAGLGLYLKKLGMHYSVPGAGFFPMPKYRFVYSGLDYMFFNYSNLSVLREQTCYEYLTGLNLSKRIYLLPDMAFYCKSTETDERISQEIIKKYHIFSNRINIGLTICENSISFHGSFLTSINKSEDHRIFISQLLDKIACAVNCRFFFLPHCIEDGAGNDIVIAEDIQKRMIHKHDTFIIKDDLPVNVLRSLIRSLDFMLGERTHSIINSTSMSTPYFMLTSSLDFRSHDIIGKGIGLPDQIIDLDNPKINDVALKIIAGIKNRFALKQHLISYQHTIEESRKQSMYLLVVDVQ